MIFHTKKKNVQSLTLKIDDIIIERVASIKIFGTNYSLDEHLTWKCHINKISNTISQCMGVLNRLKCFLPIQTTNILIYNSLVVAHLNFGLLIWGFKCEKFTKLQTKVIRILSLSKCNAHREPLFKQPKLLKIIDIFKLQKLKFYYKYKTINYQFICNHYHCTPTLKLMTMQLIFNIIFMKLKPIMLLLKTVYTLTYLRL